MKTETDRIPSVQQRQEMIAIAAYYLAERRGFAPGGADADWLRAEQVIDTMIAERRISRSTGTDARSASIRNALQFA
ncbi:hypothetical protein CCR95_01650 [Thiocystis minor]|uniref:DUF2934 domain-containing protein n=1 Tax=Thiocystis minor TaxID=61597 RepID=UPI001912E3E4|nr:DUF2934 domain-containing protein [Thiocystis minor]MBK5962829.1 hypothetical protein [Thiocystis minor]